ncbi:integrin alpha-6 [Clupea harengus]|uniref:Integrin alpha-6 n=1 Tax=Clupea harengus TaxID=7950 RepID=A0A6P3W7N6_CLUHA|nr:integrin alpha-6 [Clupea harengus]
MGFCGICWESYVWISFMVQCICIGASNLDTHNIIRKDGEPGSLFGFSLALHRQLIPSDKRMLLVGAPRARALARQNANITGGLYNCDITSPSHDCERVEFDNEADVLVENKENQWMGVTVQSQGPGGKIVTCAHRYQRRLFGNTRQESRDIIGRCYVLSQDLTIDTQSDEDGGNWKFCEGRARGHERFGSCQQGLSATFTKDYHYLIFGAPGAYNWKGIVRVEQKNNTLLEMGFYDDGPYEVGDENRLDPALVPVAANSYLGFSLDSGHSITRKGQLTVVSGAPRTNHSGAVVLLRKEGEASTMLSPEYILEGPGLASSFGYDVAVVDLNNDGWQDIVVGAPQFFMKDGEVGGAVYVYINKAGKWNDITPVRLNGTKDSMFGLAVENIGDINLDTYQDIAVGAPYDDGGAGKVYIYHGSANGIITEPAQVLKGRKHKIKLFGYSLAGNMDLDQNSYPDIAVGSLSDSVFVYRARPIISIKKDVTVSPKEIDLTKKTCGNSICLTVEACFSYKANPSTYNPKITISYLFEAESERRKQGLQSRVTFLDKKNSDQDFQSTGTLELQRQNKRACFRSKLRLQDTIKDKLRALSIEVSVAVLSSKRGKRQSALPQLVPVISPSDSKKVLTEVHFLKEGCGADNICQSNLQLQYSFCYRTNQDVFLPLPLQNGVPLISLSDQKDIALELTVTNRGGDDAHEAKLVGMFPSSLSYSAFRLPKTGDKQMICTANQNGSQTDCELGNPFKRDDELKFYIILGTVGISLNTTEIVVNLLLETTSQQEKPIKVEAKARVVIELMLSVLGAARPPQVYFGGDVKGESAMKSQQDVGSLVEYEFRITNWGKPLKSFGTASLNIQWPKESSLGKWVLYLMEIKTEGLDQITCSPEREVNPLSLPEESAPSRQRREVEERKTREGGGLQSLFAEKRKYKTLTCHNEVKCVEIKCPLQGLDSNAVILLRSRLWNSTFLEDYATFSYLDLIIKASLSLDGSAQNIILKNAETEVKVTVFPEKTVALYSGVPWWIILVAVLAGILMLALLVFLLWKCGFFKRAQKDQFDAAYHKAEIHVQASDKEKVTTEA